MVSYKSIIFMSIFVFCFPLITCASSTFFDLEYKGITVKLPSNWKYNNKQMNDHLNNLSESLLKLNKLDIDQGNNLILAAGNLKLDDDRPSIASIRISVKDEPSLSQKELRKLSKSDLAEFNRENSKLVKQSANMMLNIDGVNKVDVLSSSVKKVNNNICTYSELAVTYEDDLKIQESYVCLFKSRRIKLSSSYSYKAKQLVKPTLDYIVSTLKVIGD